MLWEGVILRKELDRIAHPHRLGSSDPFVVFCDVTAEPDFERVLERFVVNNETVIVMAVGVAVQESASEYLLFALDLPFLDVQHSSHLLVT